MKELIVSILIMGGFIGILIVSTPSKRISYEEQCESNGGVVVYSSHALNCWKDGGYIKAK
jgi:hypothetical protein